MRQTTLMLAAFLLFAAAASTGCEPSTDGAVSSAPATAAGPASTTTTVAPPAPETSSPNLQPDTTASSSNTTVARGEDAGTRANPVLVGNEAQVGPWKVKVLGSTLDADDIVYNHSEFNEPPQAGMQYVLIRLEAARTAEEAAAFWADTYCEFVGSKGGRFELGYADIPDAMSETGEVVPGASISGNLVFEVSTGQVAGGTLRLSEGFSFEEVEVFFAVD
jgi:hypothetical protein